MSEQHDPAAGPAEQDAENGSTAYTITTERVKPSTARKWLSGAALVAAGLVAGSGATYAVTSATQPTPTQSGFQGGPRGTGGERPEGMAGGPRGTGQQQSTAPGSGASTQAG